MKTGIAISICLFSCLVSSEAFACKYTFRDAGFVDMGSSPCYYLYFFTNDSMAQEVAPFIKTEVALANTNVMLENINLDRDPAQPAVKYLNLWNLDSPPAALLVTPDDRSLNLLDRKGDGPFKERARSLLDRILSSPKQKEIRENLIESYCIILLIQGKDPITNRATQDEVAGAIERVRSRMKTLIKPVKRPPRLIIISQDNLPQEKILLFSLGVMEADTDLPNVIVLYGRGRQIGPLLRGEAITERAVTQILHVIGTDCECGLDRIWFLGPTIPLRWDEDMRVQAAKELGFDPENPLVKLEVSQIIATGRSGSNLEKDPADPFSEDILFGYSEEVIAFEEDKKVEKDPGKATEEPGTPRSAEPASRYGALLLTLAGIVLFIFLGTALVLFRAMRRGG